MKNSDSRRKPRERVTPKQYMDSAASAKKKLAPRPMSQAAAPVAAAKPWKHKRQIDLREQLANDGDVGPIKEVSIPESMITKLRGIVVDIDPKWLNRDKFSCRARSNPERLYKRSIRRMLTRHPVLAKAEVRNSGTGLHVIIWLKEPVEFESEGDRQRWAAIVKVIQRLLPSDPTAPGITALTRAIGSINSKNNKPVRRLKKGESVTADEIIQLVDQVRAAPFRMVMSILFGRENISPCPICGEDETSLAVLDKVGRCYGSCGDVSLSKLFDLFLKTEE